MEILVRVVRARVTRRPAPAGAGTLHHRSPGPGEREKWNASNGQAQLDPARVSVFILTSIRRDDDEEVSYESLFVQNSSCTVLCLVAWQWSCYGGAQSNCQFLSDSASNYKIHASWAQPRLISLASTGQHCLLWGLGSDLVIILESWSEAVKITNHIWHTTRSLSRISQASFPRQLIQVIPMFREYRKSDRIEKPYFCDHEWRFIIVIVEK